MKKVLGIVLILAVITGVSFIWIKSHPAIFWTSASILGGALLCSIVWAFENIMKFVGKSVYNVLYIVVALVIVGLLAGYKIVPSVASFAVTIVLTFLLFLTTIRSIAQKAHTSLFWGDLFSKITGYKLRYIITEYDVKEKIMKIEKRQSVIENEVAKKNIVDALKNWGYNVKESQEAADYALGKKPDASLEEQIKCALNYIASNKVLGNGK